VDREKHQIVLDGAFDARLPQLVGHQPLVVVQADEHFLAAHVGRVQAEPQRVEQRVNHEQGIDDKSRRQEDEDVDRERLAAMGGLIG